MIRPLTGALAVLAVAAPAASATERPLAWRDCDGGFECATAKVPLDHDRPHGRSIELALIRFGATDRAQRIGSLFIHPGALLAYLEDLTLPAPGTVCVREAPFGG